MNLKVEAAIKTQSCKQVFLNRRQNLWKAYLNILNRFHSQYCWNLEAYNIVQKKSFMRDLSKILIWLLVTLTVSAHLFHRTFFMAAYEIRRKVYGKYSSKENIKYKCQTSVFSLHLWASINFQIVIYSTIRTISNL